MQAAGQALGTPLDPGGPGVSSHLFDSHGRRRHYCSRCGIWEGAAPTECRQLTMREHLGTRFARAGKSWWPTVRSKVNHARMSRDELVFGWPFETSRPTTEKTLSDAWSIVPGGQSRRDHLRVPFPARSSRVGALHRERRHRRAAHHQRPGATGPIGGTRRRNLSERRRSRHSLVVVVTWTISRASCRARVALGAGGPRKGPRENSAGCCARRASWMGARAFVHEARRGDLVLTEIAAVLDVCRGA